MWLPGNLISFTFLFHYEMVKKEKKKIHTRGSHYVCIKQPSPKADETAQPLPHALAAHPVML